MERKIYSVWQDPDDATFHCKYCKADYLGKDCHPDYEESFSLVVLRCQACNAKLAILNLEASTAEIQKFASQGYKAAVNHLKNNPKE